MVVMVIKEENYGTISSIDGDLGVVVMIIQGENYGTILI